MRDGLNLGDTAGGVLQPRRGFVLRQHLLPLGIVVLELVQLGLRALLDEGGDDASP